MKLRSAPSRSLSSSSGLRRSRTGPFRDEGRFEPLPPGGELDPRRLSRLRPDLYYVTDTYVADVVTTSGPLTTYATTTVHESTGRYARILDTVDTRRVEHLDGNAFMDGGARDGRLVAGTYYENYVSRTRWVRAGEHRLLPGRCRARTSPRRATLRAT